MKENGDLVEPFQLTAEDIANLKKTDDEYTLMTWEYVKEVIGRHMTPVLLIQSV